MTRTPSGLRIRFLSRTIVGATLASALITLVAPVHAASGRDPGEEPIPESAWPIEPHPLVAPFEPPACAYCSGHRGADLGGLPLRPVLAAISGKITYAGVLAGRGVLVIDDGARRVTYEPVTALVVKGTAVVAGEVVGTLELAQSHCFPDACLHLGLIDDATDEYLDPMTLFSTRAPVRLLPFLSEAQTAAGVDEVTWLP